MNVLGVIPARGGSKGIPRKSLVPLAGRPLLAWTADAVRGSRTLTRTVLSTDDVEVAEAGRLLGLDVPFLRPAELAEDDTPMVPVLQHVLKRLKEDEQYEADLIVLLQPTSPLRESGHIDRGVELLIASGADSVVTVVDVPHHFNPASVLREENGRLVPLNGSTTVTRRQDKPRVFARNGPAVVVTRPAVIAAGNLYGADTRPLVMTAQESVDIDTPWDLEVAGWLLGRRLR